jgi:hypothetical protein
MCTSSVQGWSKALLLAISIGSALSLAGCAGNPPTAQMALATSAVKGAEAAGAHEFATLELKTARDKMRQAEQASFEKDFDEARLLAEQAEWDARLAERKARAAKAERAVMDAEKGVEELRKEGLRSAE